MCPPPLKWVHFKPTYSGWMQNLPTSISSVPTKRTKNLLHVPSVPTPDSNNAQFMYLIKLLWKDDLLWIVEMLISGLCCLRNMLFLSFRFFVSILFPLATKKYMGELYNVLFDIKS